MNNNVVPIRTTAKAANNSALDSAAEWIAKMDRGLSLEEEQQLKTWLQSSEEHREMLFKMAKLWDNMAALERLKSLFPEPPVKQSRRAPLAMAASVAFIAMLFTFLWLSAGDSWLSDSELVVLSEQRFETGTGDSKKVTLSDGSLLSVNTNTSVKVTFMEQQRVIELFEGEIHIQVAHNTERPLSVYAAGQIIQAVGTAFNVELLEDQVELIVTEGKVRVARQAEDQPDPLRPMQNRLDDSLPSLVQGQKSLLTVAAPTIETVETADINAALSWQQGNLVFRGEPLQQVLAEVSRYNAVTFELPQNELNHIQVAGLFKTNDLNGFLSALQQNFAIENQRTSDNRIVLRRGS
ncbi:FecR family protein [Planctobacterium marinum]|uniref:FecR family protein n=1 Tax=Planctobacterium marinum TaxID=1631968 RepID=UPI001E5521B6|nr:FecR domain-containing protein [Planctobacterium marinum]MCC2606908.1 FecR domain-containing protein [Planctobacterium marinum]